MDRERRVDQGEFKGEEVNMIKIEGMKLSHNERKVIQKYKFLRGTNSKYEIYYNGPLKKDFKAE